MCCAMSCKTLSGRSSMPTATAALQKAIQALCEVRGICFNALQP